MADKFHQMKPSDIVMLKSQLEEMESDDKDRFIEALAFKLDRFHKIVVEMEKADAAWLAHLTKLLRETLEC